MLWPATCRRARLLNFMRSPTYTNSEWTTFQWHGDCTPKTVKQNTKIVSFGKRRFASSWCMCCAGISVKNASLSTSNGARNVCHLIWIWLNWWPFFIGYATQSKKPKNTKNKTILTKEKKKTTTTHFLNENQKHPLPSRHEETEQNETKLITANLKVPLNKMSVFCCFCCPFRLVSVALFVSR